MTLRTRTVALAVAAGLTSACSAAAQPPATPPTDPTASNVAGQFPDMSGFVAVNPDDYREFLDNPGRPTKLVKYVFTTPDGIACGFGQPASAYCGGINLPSIPPATCDPAQGIYRYKTISTSQGVREWARGSADCSDNSSSKVLPPLHTLTIEGMTCGVDDKGTTACKDPQGRGFVLSPSWSGWLPKG